MPVMPMLAIATKIQINQEIRCVSQFIRPIIIIEKTNKNVAVNTYLMSAHAVGLYKLIIPNAAPHINAITGHVV